MCATRRRPSARAGHVPRASWHCWPRLEHPVRLPNRVACSICFPFFSTARSTEATAAPSVPTKHRRYRSSSPLQKRTGRLAPLLAVIPSPLSTVQSSQSSLGKGQSSVFFHRRHGCPRRSWCSTRPAILASLPLLLCLALGSRSAAEARRVTNSSRDAVVSPEHRLTAPPSAIHAGVRAKGR